MKAKTFDPIKAFLQLEDDLHKGNLPKLLFMVAPSRGKLEVFFAEQAVRQYKEWVNSQDNVEFLTHDPLDDNFDLQVLCQDLQAGALFANSKVIVIRRADSLLRRTQRDGKEPTILENALGNFLNKQTKQVIGVVLCILEQCTAAAPSVKLLVQEGAMLFEARKLYATPPPWVQRASNLDSEVGKWLSLRVKQKKIRARPEALCWLLDKYGAELTTMEQALEAVGCGGELKILDREKNLPSDGVMWSLLEAIFSRNLSQALQLSEQIFTHGFADWGKDKITHPQAIFTIWNSLLVKETRKLLHARNLLDAGLSAEQVCSELSIKSFSAKGFIPRLLLWDARDLFSLLQGLLQLERKIKTGLSAAPQLLLEHFLLRHCVKPAGVLR